MKNRPTDKQINAEEWAPWARDLVAARIRDVSCPQCKRDFELRWKDYERDGSGYKNVRVTLEIRGCPSGGIYDVIIRCPHCNYEEPL